MVPDCSGESIEIAFAGRVVEAQNYSLNHASHSSSDQLSANSNSTTPVSEASKRRYTFLKSNLRRYIYYVFSKINVILAIAKNANIDKPLN